jgi:phospholipase C
MAAPIDSIKTIVLVMLENRSFDHMLGHLTLDDPALPLEGLRAERMAEYSNDHNGSSYPLYPLIHDTQLETDLPHEAVSVAQQMRKSPVTGKYTMHGFVDAFATANPHIPINPQCIPMAYFPSKLVPVTNFLATHFCTCDHWFSPLPTSTQPNRTMAFCGYSPVYKTKTQLILIDDNLFKWMDGKVEWRVYHDGFPFFALYPALWSYVLGPRFSRFIKFQADWAKAPAAGDPQVIVIEPCYQDAPHFDGTQPNDNHAPLAVGWGEAFLRQIYQTLISNPERWAGTLMVLYSDEHGGFYDHVPPAPIPDQTTGSEPFSFETTGPRIPALLVSPFVKPGSVCSATLDHTSVLQFLAEKFTPGNIYSQRVDARRKAGVQSISAALDATPNVNPPAAPAAPIVVETPLGKPVNAPSDMQQSFTAAATQMKAAHPDETLTKFPELRGL